MSEKSKGSFWRASAVARWLLIGVIIAAVLAGGLVLTYPLWVDVLIKRGALKATERLQTSLLNDGKLHVIVVGTGSPSADPERVQACVAIIADNDFLLFDAGGAAAYRLELLGLPMPQLSTVFLTHLHSDHIADLPLVANNSWRHGRKHHLDVYGPTGTEAVVDGFNKAHLPDLEFRYENTKSYTAPLDIALPRAHAIPTPEEGKRTLVYQGPSGIKVYAFVVDHHPVELAFGFRIEYKGLVVVISGDTRRCLNIARQAQGADVLIHEAFNKNLVDRMLDLTADDIVASPQGRILASEAREVQHYHASPVEAAEIASKAKVKTLVFTHIIPPLGSGLARPLVTEPLFLKGVDERFSGTVIIAEDGTHLTLIPQKTEEQQ